MRMLRITISFCLFCLLQAVALYGQYTVDHHRDPLRAQVVMDEFHDPYSFNLQYEEAPHPSGNTAWKTYLRNRKLEAQKIFPFRDDVLIPRGGGAPPPEILASFSGNNIITGTPLDNHLAVGMEEHVISAINTHMLVTNNTGFWLGSYPLDAFFSSVGTNNRFFDPRVIYDPEQNRFILVLINASECEDSQIVLAFSQTNNPKGAWNLYALDGCIDNDGTFADYPMIAITDTELFLTYNEVHSDSSWQTGFMGTQIHQINKLNGFNGETLNRKVWRDIAYNGRLLRNIVPVRNADESLPQSMYFLSNRNFDIMNDTTFLLHITGLQDDPDAMLDITYRIMDVPYGVPPYAVQTRDSMDTNDARNLDAFLLNGQIQYVHNTMDFNTGKSAAYHGIIYTDAGQFNGSGHVIVHPTDYLGYPGIAWTGADPSQQDAIIIVSHCSSTRHPGASAIYYNGLGEYSDFVTVIEGTKPVDMLISTVERWGDYIGIQRLYHQPGSVWISCSYGRQGNVNEAWIAKLARHEEMVSTDDPAIATPLAKTYPNPSNDYVTIELDNPEGKEIEVTLFDQNGHPVKVFFTGKPEFSGKAKINFSMHALPAGSYVVTVILDKKEIITRTIIKM